MVKSVAELLEEKGFREDQYSYKEEYERQLSAELDKNGFISFEEAINYLIFIGELYGQDKSALVGAVDTLKTFTGLTKEKGITPPPKRALGSKPVKLFLGITWHKQVEQSVPGIWEILIADRQRDYGHETYPELKAGVTPDGLTDMHILQASDYARGGHQTITDEGIQACVNGWVADRVEEFGLTWTKGH